MTRHRSTTNAAARRRRKRADRAGEQLAEILADAAAKQTRATIRAFKQETGALTASGEPTPPVDPTRMWDPDLWDGALSEADGLIAGFVIGELETDFGIQVTSEQPFVQGVTVRLIEMIDSWSQAFKQLISRVVDDGHKNLKSVADVSKDLREAGVITKRSADTIARTQMIAASNEASHKGATAFAQPGDLRRWIATNDSRTRPDHRDMDGVEVPFDEPFIVGGHRAQFPGDRSLPPEQKIACRCSWVWVPVD